MLRNIITENGHRLMQKHIAVLLIFTLMFAACEPSSDPEASEREEQRHYTTGLVVPHEVTTQIFDQYRVQMAELGYLEGENVTYIQKGPSSNLVQLLNFPRELLEENVDLMI